MAFDDGPIPPYFQLKTLLLDAVLSGEYRPGDRLPTEHELCRRYGISRTPVSRALSELAEEGVLVRQRRNGTFVNPHWLRRPSDRAEVRIVVPEGPWESMIRAAATSTAVGVSVVTVPRPTLHQFLTHAVAEGQAPDLALLDSVWLPEFAEAGFVHALEDVDERWIRDEYEVDFLAPLVAANRYGGRTYAVSAFADVVGLWYRREAVEGERRSEPLRTWAELRSTARSLAARGVRHPVAMPGGSKGGETTSYCLIALLASNGASVVGPHGVTLASRATEQVLRFVRSLIEDDLMAEDVVGYEWNRSARRLADGDAALSVGGSYEALALAERLGVSLDELWSLVGFVPIPAGPRGSPASLTGTMVYGIFRQAAQPKLAMRLLEQVVSPRGARRHLARDWPDSPETVCRRARGARASVRRADGDDARQCGDATRDAALPTRLGPAPVDARDGAHGPARCCERSAPCRRAHRRDHWATRRRRGEPGSPLTSATFSGRSTGCRHR